MILLALLLVLVTSYLVLGLARLSGTVTVILAWAVAAWAQVVITLEVLSLFQAVTPAWVLASHVLVLVAMAIWWNRSGRPRPGLAWPATRRPAGWARRHWPVVLLAACAALAAATSLFLVIFSVSNAWDSFSFHLARPALWRQNRSLAFFSTYSPIQNDAPFVAEVGMLWTMLFAGSGQYAALTQWVYLLLTPLALYGIARELKIPRPSAAFAALLFPTFPVVIAQASEAMSDLLLVGLFVTTVYFVLVACDRDDSSLVLWAWAAVSAGLLVGTKPTAYLLVPGLALWVALWVYRRRRPAPLRWLIQPSAILLVSLALFCGPVFVQSTIYYGSPLGRSRTETVGLVVERPNLATLASGLLRTIATFWDTPFPSGLGLPPRAVGAHLIESAVVEAHKVIGLDVGATRTTHYLCAACTPFQLPQTAAAPLFSFFGPLGLVLVWPLLFWQVGRWVIRLLRGDGMHWPGWGVGLLAVVALSFALLICWLLKYDTILGRWYMGLVALVLPGVSDLYRSRSRPLARVALVVICVVAVYTTLVSSLFNQLRPLIAVNGPSVLAMSKEEMMYIEHPYYRPPYDAVQAAVPTGRLGLSLPYREAEQWEYPFFGLNLERTVVPILPADLAARGPGPIMEDNRLDGLLVDATFLRPELLTSDTDDVRLVRVWNNQDPYSLYLPDKAEHGASLSVQNRILAVFGDELSLVGYDLDTAPETPNGPPALLLTLYWHVLKTPAARHDIYVDVRDVEGARVAEGRRAQFWARPPTSEWMPDEVVIDRYSVPGPSAGRETNQDFFLTVELLDAATNSPVPVSGEPGTVDREVVQLCELPHDYLAPADGEGFAAVFGGGIALMDEVRAEGFALGQGATLALTWQVPARLREDYTMFVHLVNQQGQNVAQCDVRLLRSGEALSSHPRTIAAACPLTIPEYLAPGDYRFEAGLYDVTTMARAGIAGDPAGENVVRLGTLTVSTALELSYR